MELNQIYNGDCLELMPLIADKSIDMILCDLPYGITNCKWDTKIPLDKLWKQYERVIKDNGAIVLTASQPFTSALVMSNLKLFKYDLVWEKNQISGFMNAKRQFLRTHESLLVFYKSQPTYNPQFEKHSNTTYERFKSNGFRERTKKETYSKDIVYAQNKRMGYEIDYDRGRYPDSILKFKCVHTGSKERVHPTQKPVELFEYLIRTFTIEGQLILDNCIGSGTTAISCLNTGRNYIGFEKDKEIFDKCMKRICNHQPLLISK